MKKVFFCIMLAVLALLAACGKNTYEGSMKLANKYIIDGKYEEAILEFKKAIEIEPNNYEPYESLVDAYILLNNDETEQGIIDAVKMYFEVAPSDRRLLEKVCMDVDKLSYISAYTILDEIYAFTGDDEVLKKRNEIGDTLYEDSAWMLAYTGVFEQYRQAYSMVMAYEDYDEVLSACPDVNETFLRTGSALRIQEPKYWLHDFDDDGIPEIIIGCNSDSDYSLYQYVYDMYTFSNDKLIRLDVGTGDHRWFASPVMQDKVLVYGNGGADYKAYRLNELKNGSFHEVDSVVQDGIEDYNSGWGIWYHNEERITEPEAKSIISGYNEMEIMMPWDDNSDFAGDKYKNIKDWVAKHNSHSEENDFEKQKLDYAECVGKWEYYTPADSGEYGGLYIPHMLEIKSIDANKVEGSIYVNEPETENKYDFSTQLLTYPNGLHYFKTEYFSEPMQELKTVLFEFKAENLLMLNTGIKRYFVKNRSNFDFSSLTRLKEVYEWNDQEWSIVETDAVFYGWNDTHLVPIYDIMRCAIGNDNVTLDEHPVKNEYGVDNVDSCTINVKNTNSFNNGRGYEIRLKQDFFATSQTQQAGTPGNLKAYGGDVWRFDIYTDYSEYLSTVEWLADAETTADMLNDGTTKTIYTNVYPNGLNTGCANLVNGKIVFAIPKN